ncbi:hypothetical protein MTsPCn5_27330 [Croceitalea sp. MTPC5]|nr:hypothetical protein MTsPCn5_27330 [Croceitalea sp. MTPC5]
MTALLYRATYFAAFLFCRALLLVSTIFGLFLFIIKLPLSLVLPIKLLFWVFLYFVWTEQRLKQRLIFYYNLGLSKKVLFYVAFLYDLLLTIGLNLILYWFLK